MVDQRNPRCLGQERNGARRSGIRLEHVELPAVHRELEVEQSARTDPGGDRPGELADLLLQRGGHRGRGDDTGRVARVNAGRLDVLEDPTDPDRLTVAEEVDVELERAFEELVYERRLVELELLGPPRDAHAAAAEHVVRADEHRIADAFGNRPGLRSRRRRSPGRGAQPKLAEQGAEAPSVLRTLDRRQRIAEEREPGGCDAGGERERRLPAELHDHPFRLLELADVERAFQRQRFEIEPVARVVVGRHRLRVGIDQDGVVAKAAKGARRSRAAVVELDPLADPVRPGAEDHDRGT